MPMDNAVKNFEGSMETMTFFYLHLALEQEKNHHKQREILKKMAISFRVGTSNSPYQPHPLENLHGAHLVRFLSFLYQELQLTKNKTIAEMNTENLKLLTNKIYEACIFIKECPIHTFRRPKNSILKELRKLANVQCCFPTLQKLCINQLIKRHGFFKNLSTMKISDDLKNEIRTYQLLIN